LPTHAAGSRKAGKLANRQATFRSLLFLVKWKINFQTISFVDGFDWLFFLEAASEVSLCSLPILLSFILFYSPRPRFPAYKWQINSLVAQISWMQSSGVGWGRVSGESVGNQQRVKAAQHSQGKRTQKCFQFQLNLPLARPPVSPASCIRHSALYTRHSESCILQWQVQLQRTRWVALANGKWEMGLRLCAC